MAKAIHDYTEQSILVVCFTNHALDDILTSLLDIGIPESSMVRLGGKSTSKTEGLILRNQQAGKHSFDWESIDNIKTTLERLSSTLSQSFGQLMTHGISEKDVLEYLEFEDPEHYEAFMVPESGDGMQVVGSGGKAAKKAYLLERWVNGQDPGAFSDADNINFAYDIWNMAPEARRSKYREWRDTLEAEQINEIYESITTYGMQQAKLDQLLSSKDISLIRGKRVIGCTTTAAAKFGFILQAAAPDVVLVEEAGEILEAHILTALSPTLSQMILIGDHKLVHFFLLVILRA